MKYKDKLIQDYTLDELEAIDWDLAAQEYNHKQKMDNPKFEKLNPKPELGNAFKQLRQEIKEEMERKRP